MKLVLAAVCAALLGVLITALIFLGRGEGTSSLLPPASADETFAPAPARLETAESERAERIAPVDPARQTEPAMNVVAEETREELSWRLKYGALSLQKLRRAQKELEETLDKLAEVPFDEYVRRGQYEVLGSGRRQLLSWDNSRVTKVCYPSAAPGGEKVVLVTLNQREFPELYKLRRESLWMEKRITELRGGPIPTISLPADSAPQSASARSYSAR